MADHGVRCALLPEWAEQIELRPDNCAPMSIQLGDWLVDGKVGRIVMRIDLSEMKALVDQVYRARGHSKLFGGGAIQVFRACGPDCPQDWDEAEQA